MLSDEDNWDADGLAYELEVARGMSSHRLSKRTATERIWRAIADGNAHEATKNCWLDYVARQLVDGLIDKRKLNDKLRGSAALQALGLYDKGDSYAELRSFVETWMAFQDLSGPEPRPGPPPRPKDILKFARERGMFEGVKDKLAIERIRRQLNKVIEGRLSHPKN